MTDEPELDPETLDPDLEQPSEAEPAREPHPSPRQTLTYLRELFEQHGIKPKNKLGQNFLIDLNLVDLIVRVAQLAPQDLVVEVGSGTGSLTTRLAVAAGAVLTVELDYAFADLTREAVHGHENVVLVQGDILENKNELSREVLATLQELRRKPGLERLKLVANLPYAVATPVISNFLLSDLPFERMVVMVQREIAERLVARPDTRDYGALAVLVQSLADVQIIRRLPPSVFFPRPQVASAIVRIFPNASKRAHVGDVGKFRNFLRDLYTHRRKNLRGSLLGFHGKPFSKEEVDAKLAELGLERTIRAETLDREQHLRLCTVFGGDQSGRA